MTTSHKGVDKTNLGDIAAQMATPDIAQDMVTDFKAEDVLILGSYTQVCFEVEAKEIVVLPGAVTLKATQKGFNLRQSIRKGICEVHKGNQVFKGDLKSKSNALNGETNFVLLTLCDGTCVKIIKPEKIISYPDTTHVHSQMAETPIRVAMTLENALISEFKHSLSEVLGLQGESREPGFYLEQGLVIENESPYCFKAQGSTRIAVPKLRVESDERVENDILTLEGLGELTPRSKEIVIFSELKMDSPRKYNIVSIVCHDRTQTVYEFTLPGQVYPGSITQYLPSGDIVNVSVVPYTEKGGKIFLDQGICEGISVLESKSNDTKFNLKLENRSPMSQPVRLQESDKVCNISLNGILMTQDILLLEPGIHIITGNYKS